MCPPEGQGCVWERQRQRGRQRPRGSHPGPACSGRPAWCPRDSECPRELLQLNFTGFPEKDQRAAPPSPHTWLSDSAHEDTPSGRQCVSLDGSEGTGLGMRRLPVGAEAAETRLEQDLSRRTSPKEGDGQPASRTPARPAGVQSCLSLSRGFPGGSDGKESACNTGDPGLIPGSGRSLGEGKSYTLQYSCLEIPMCRGA